MDCSLPHDPAVPLRFCLRRRRARAGQAGYALPLALGGGLLLLLGSLGAQSALHQSRLRHASALGVRHREDALASAAHQLVAQVVAQHPCLLSFPLAAWSGPGLICADAAAQGRLREPPGTSLPYRLESWQPASLPVGDGGAQRPGRITLELSRRSGPDARPWRAAFALDVQGDPPRVLALRELGLRGVRP